MNGMKIWQITLLWERRNLKGIWHVFRARPSANWNFFPFENFMFIISNRKTMKSITLCMLMNRLTSQWHPGDCIVTNRVQSFTRSQIKFNHLQGHKYNSIICKVYSTKLMKCASLQSKTWVGWNFQAT